MTRGERNGSIRRHGDFALYFRIYANARKGDAGRNVHRDTPRRLRHASGYIELGLLSEASDELEAVAFEDRLSVPMLKVRLSLHTAAKHWDIVAGVARELVSHDPANLHGWLCRGWALRELQRVQDARDALLEAELIHGRSSAQLHYDLARCHCLLGERSAAIDQLAQACRMDPGLKQGALDETDLASIWGAVDQGGTLTP